MSTFTYPIEIAADAEGPFEHVEAYVDTGAFYTQAPASLLRRLGVEPMDTATFITADGTRNVSEIGSIRLRIDGRERPAIVVFAEEQADILLGAHALEGFLLGVDPVNKRLVPMTPLPRR